MRLSLDRSTCQGHGRCYVLAPELFDCDDEGYAVLRTDGDVVPEQEAAGRLAADSCPEFAITVAD